MSIQIVNSNGNSNGNTVRHAGKKKAGSRNLASGVCLPHSMCSARDYFPITLKLLRVPSVKVTTFTKTPPAGIETSAPDRL